jgi:RNA polymerase sigma-70 factor, ECF subfamily
MRRKRPPSALPRMADEELLELVGQRNAEAFELLYDRHSRVAYSLALRVLGDRSAADDVVQDAFLAVWRRAATYAPSRGSVRSWLLSIVHNRAVDRVRTSMAVARRRQALETEAARITVPDTAEGGITRALGEAVRADLADLPEEQAAVLKLAYYGGFTHSEIAQCLELPVGTVKSRIRLGLNGLRERMGGAGVPT